MTEKKQDLLALRDLVVRYHVQGKPRTYLTAVRGVSLQIAPGEIYGLVGESGSGKSSLAHAILKLVPVESGQILLQGQDLGAVGKTEFNKARREVQLVFQDSLAALSPRRTIRQTIIEPLNHFKLGETSQREGKVIEALETVGLDPALKHRYPGDLSGGQRQRVALARALVTEPALIIADEPVSSLDVSVQAHIIKLILELRERLGIAFLFVSHDLAVVQQLADRIGVMYLGKLVEEASANSLFNQPSHPYTRSLLAAVPVADPHHPPPIVLTGEPPSPLTPPAGCVFHKRCPESIASCALTEPEEFLVDGPGKQSANGVNLKSAEHRVKCHLCNPKKP